MIEVTKIRGREIDRTPDLVDLVTAARDAGHEVMLIERPMPDAVSVAAIGRAFDIVAAPGGVALEGADGKTIDFEAGDNRILAASRLWQSLSASLDAIAVGGFAYRPDRDPGGAWSGFPALLFRVPALAVLRRRGRTYVSGATPELLIRRSGTHAFAQPMAGSVARGVSDADDERLARQLTESAKDAIEHRVVSEFVVGALRPFALHVTAHDPEVVRFTNIQHLA